MKAIEYSIIILFIFAISGCQEIAEPDSPPDPQELAKKSLDSIKDTKSYGFNITTRFDIPLEGGKVDVLTGVGEVDYKEKKLKTTMTMTNRSFEIIVVDEATYLKQSGGQWEEQDLGEDSVSIWENEYDVLGQQYSILENAENITMAEHENYWVLNIIPEREVLLSQMRRSGVRTIKEDEIKTFSIQYWIERENYHISRMENKIALEMNIMGLVTPMEISTNANFYDFNNITDIKNPVSNN